LGKIGTLFLLVKYWWSRWHRRDLEENWRNN